MNHPHQHPDDTELMMAIDGELTSSRRADVEAHVAGCVACRDRREHFGLMLDQVGTVYRSDLERSTYEAPFARPRFERALRDRASLSERSWIVRVRLALTPPAVRAGVALALSMVLLTVWSPRSIGTLRVSLDEAPSGAILPIAALTPGAVATLSAGELCDGARPAPIVSEQSRRDVLRSYGMESVPGDQYELDALITPELGGSTDARNLWPQWYASTAWNARVKDELERLLPQLVCSGQLSLVEAQREIARDWVGAYKRYFNTSAPLRAHVGPPIDDDDLVFEPHPRLVAQSSDVQLASLFVEPRR